MAATLPKTPDMHKKLKKLESEIQTLRGLIGPGDRDSD
jgi:hypothetical protein